MMRSRLPILIALALLLAPAAGARAEGEDPLAGALFAPDLVMRHRFEIELDDRQVEGIKAAVHEAQGLFLDRQLDLQAEVGKLRRLLEPARVEESEALAQLDRVLGLEREIKRAQIALLLRIKNLLLPEQQRRLAALRAAD